MAKAQEEIREVLGVESIPRSQVECQCHLFVCIDAVDLRGTRLLLEAIYAYVYQRSDSSLPVAGYTGLLNANPSQMLNLLEKSCAI